ncbi:unnamed protein product [Pseudo-nitzschia multistriata]|uniref:Uncharacterized protein n=1 Tax=Pseudo-nitzschia multistriata TaxID=183589 RepID=A0A448Z604_9STRA|nr:unnamed protein product [Pseudo-nitzschia multistriata]
MAVILEGCYKINNEGMLDVGHDILLTKNTLYLMMPDDCTFAQLFQSVWGTSFLVTDEPDLPERSNTQNTELHKIIELNVFVQGNSMHDEWLSKTFNISDDTLDIFSGKNSAFCVCFDLDSDGGRASDWFFQPKRSKVVGIHQGVDLTLGIRNYNSTLTNNIEIRFVFFSLLRKDGSGGKSLFR